MEKDLPNDEANERRFDIEKDTELTARLLGALGIYDASQDTYKNPDHTDSVWQDRSWS